MAHHNLIIETEGPLLARPEIREIGLADIKDALQQGWGDFKAMPTHLPFTIAIYLFLSIFLFIYSSNRDILGLIFPVFAGYTLIGPLVACGMYELSRRNEAGKFTSRSNAFYVFRSPNFGSIAILGAFLFMVYFAWLAAAEVFYVRNFGDIAPASAMEFMRQVFDTDAGTLLVYEVCSAGFAFAVFVLIISMVSFPMLIDMEVNVLTAVVTSLRAFYYNVTVFFAWGAIVSLALILGTIPAFLGLGVVLPVLGHATWHLYRKMVKN